MRTRAQAVTLANNSCGYGPLTSPYIAGVSPDSPLANLRPQSGCGTCLQVVCEQVGAAGQQSLLDQCVLAAGTRAGVRRHAGACRSSAVVA